MRFCFKSDVDIDECKEGSAECADKCINTIGSYYCYCRNGRILLPNSNTCVGNA